jgi:uncharacterized protein YggU (UPF0235/DUF167 family)
MGAIAVRVVPRSGRTLVEPGPGEVVVRVRAAPERGNANREAARALAEALGVPPTRVRLVRGRRSRLKIFAVDGRTDEELRTALQGP